MKTFAVPSIIAFVILFAILSLSPDTKPNDIDVDQELTEQINQSLSEMETKHRQEVLNEMIQMQEEINDLYQELIRLEELKLKLQTGKAWSA